MVQGGGKGVKRAEGWCIPTAKCYLQNTDPNFYELNEWVIKKEMFGGLDKIWKFMKKLKIRELSVCPQVSPR